eukprot:SAG31_NODE_7970_length_1552_cov_1.160358_2_plen_177_part_00
MRVAAELARTTLTTPSSLMSAAESSEPKAESSAKMSETVTVPSRLMSGHSAVASPVVASPPPIATQDKSQQLPERMTHSLLAQAGIAQAILHVWVGEPSHCCAEAVAASTRTAAAARASIAAAVGRGERGACGLLVSCGPVVVLVFAVLLGSAVLANYIQLRGTHVQLYGSSTGTW